MNRFTLLAGVFAVLTLGLTYEGGLAAIHGVAALTGVGGPRLVTAGLMSLGAALMTLLVAGLTFRLARMQLVIGRSRSSARDRTA